MEHKVFISSRYVVLHGLFILLFLYPAETFLNMVGMIWVTSMFQNMYQSVILNLIKINKHRKLSF